MKTNRGGTSKKGGKKAPMPKPKRKEVLSFKKRGAIGGNLSVGGGELKGASTGPVRVGRQIKSIQKKKKTVAWGIGGQWVKEAKKASGAGTWEETTTKEKRDRTVFR